MEKSITVAPLEVSVTADTLLVFIGHSSDSNAEASALLQLETELQNELDNLHTISGGRLQYRRIKLWEWQRDAPHLIGGQDKMISPYVDHAAIALFIFKERLGEVTAAELDRCRNSPPPRQLHVIPLFWKGVPDVSVEQNAINWGQLTTYKRTLADGWSQDGNNCLRPSDPYTDLDHLKQIAGKYLADAVKHIALTHTQPAAAPTPARPVLALHHYAATVLKKLAPLPLADILNQPGSPQTRIADVFTPLQVREIRCEDIRDLTHAKELLDYHGREDQHESPGELKQRQDHLTRVLSESSPLDAVEVIDDNPATTAPSSASPAAAKPSSHAT